MNLKFQEKFFFLLINPHALCLEYIYDNVFMIPKYTKNQNQCGR